MFVQSHGDEKTTVNYHDLFFANGNSETADSSSIVL